MSNHDMALSSGSQLTLIEWAAGTGMLGESVGLALDVIGLEAVPVGYIEREATATASLVARMEDPACGQAPVWDDARTFFRGRDRGLESVDVFCAGYPCQPFSHAGRRRGSRDPRHLWPTIRGGIARMRPGFVFLENVPGHVGSGAGKVLCDLSRLGYRATCGLFSSAEAGASHRRERLFILGLENPAVSRLAGRSLSTRSRDKGQGTRCADRRGTRLPVRLENSGHERFGPRDAICGESAREERPDPDRACAGLADDTCHDELRNSLPFEERQGEPVGGLGSHVADAERKRLERDEPALCDAGDAGPAPERCGAVGHYAPARDVDLAAVSKALAKAGSDNKAEAVAAAGCCTASAVFGDWEIIARLDPSLMPAIESEVRRMADGLAPAAEQLRLSGNGVDPLAGAFAFLTLFACLWDFEC